MNLSRMIRTVVIVVCVVAPVVWIYMSRTAIGILRIVMMGTWYEEAT